MRARTLVLRTRSQRPAFESLRWQLATAQESVQEAVQEVVQETVEEKVKEARDDETRDRGVTGVVAE